MDREKMVSKIDIGSAFMECASSSIFWIIPLRNDNKV